GLRYGMLVDLFVSTPWYDSRTMQRRGLIKAARAVRSIVTLLVPLVVIAFVAACGGSTSSTATQSSTPAPTAAVTKEFLTRMPLPQAVFGGDYSTFPVSLDSGYQTSQK